MSTRRTVLLLVLCLAPALARADPAPADEEDEDDDTHVVGAIQGGLGLRGADPADEPPARVVVPRDAEGQPLIDKAYALHPAWGRAAAYRQQLAGESLYSALGREDLAEAYARRARAKRALIATGSVLMGLGLLGSTSVLITGGIVASSSDDGHGRGLLIGGGIAAAVSVGVGVAFILGGKLPSAHPISARRVARLAARQR